ncbi:Solute-binding protein family 3/N-terminal domain of MltF [Sesbania bispinosa]|nr:Solute-binding protein family 3/N-terminal domain of MltF [Sesbania bispinosa]
MEADFMIRLGDKTHVPIVTFSATSPALASLQSPYFFQIAQDDSAQVKAITTIIQAFGWKEVVLIYIDDSFGEGVIPFLTNGLQQAYVRVPYLSVISLSATNEAITEELYKLMTMPTRVFIVHMVPRLGSRLFTLAKQIGMMDQGYVWIVTDGMTNLFSSLNTSVMESMEGVLGVRPYVPRTKELDYFKARWKRKFLRDNPTHFDTNLNVFGIWAYDTTTALAMAVEKVGTTNFGFHVSNSSSNILDFEKFGIAQNGEKLREALSNTRFRGLGGDFNILGGKLQASTYEIINMVGNGEKRVGFWTPKKGLSRNLNAKEPKIYSSSKNNLGPIIWPGDTYSIPKGWEIPIKGKKLRIGVPIKEKDSYTQFVKITPDPITNSTVVTGFCIDVFKAVIDVLPYALPYEFIPFAKPDGEMAGDYNELVSQVYYGVFDAVVGDTTIIGNRSNYVDFTMPYTESGEKVVSNLGRFVVIVWVFVVLILVQSYTASLTSLLTVEQLRPTVTDVHQLIKNRMNVGYLKGSFVYGILKDLGFQDFQLKIYESPEECNELFRKGSTNGGIDAAFDEVPYVKHFLGTYCSKYVMVEPRFKTGGFGYVFPKGSPLVADISRAILNVTQGDKMRAIENAWFKESNCVESNSEISSKSLGLESFWGLFLVAGIASLLALLIFALTFLYQHRHIWLHNNPNTSIWRRIGILIRIFDQRDLDCHTFKKSETCSPHHVLGVVEASPSTHCPQSPSSQTESNISFYGDFSSDQGDAKP